MNGAADSAGGASLPGAEDAAPAPAPRLTPPGAEPPAEMPPMGDEEVDVWWGAYSGWTMLPIFVICLVLTGLFGWGCWSLAPAELARLIFFSGSGLLWFVLLARWLWRVFGYNYRLTNRRLFQDRGLFYTNTLRANLADVVHVVVERAGWERLVSVGRIRIVLADGRTLRLPGVRHPGHVAELLGECVKKARESKGERSAKADEGARNASEEYPR
jgi:hypothetical protein